MSDAKLIPRPKLSTIVAGVLVLVAIFLVIEVVGARADREAALEVAERVEEERAAAEAKADSLKGALEISTAETEAALEALAEERSRADSIAEAAAREAAEEEAAAIETGEDLGETLVRIREVVETPVDEAVDVAIEQLDEHLEADARTNAAFRLQIESLERSVEIVDNEKIRIAANLAETRDALAAREVECRLCREEVVLLRDVKDPSWFEDLLSHGKSFVVGAVGGAATVLVVVLAAG